ncbi:hypothetical protein ElyMa_006830400 [Elysia marginata]|uniref:EF-hand domain-containing protein n=1 Tax=Elysia marginata TaxID=1093978 RepID=A0AAV4J7F4_9GAST|nr:hypothetical protein ElyMa_006830400 [Elysia marginata]
MHGEATRETVFLYPGHNSTFTSSSPPRKVQGVLTTTDLIRRQTKMAAQEGWLQDQLKDLNLSFDAADTNKSGKLNMKELHEVLKAAGFSGEKREINLSSLLKRRGFRWLENKKNSAV